MNTDQSTPLATYKIIETLNEAHRIYKVQHAETGQIYVKKILTIYNRELYDMLLSHPIDFVPHIIELYEDNNTLTVIEEYLSGQTLSEMLDESHIFTPLEIKNIMSGLCDILSTLHRLDPPIVHRDIKPSNVLVTAQGQVYLIDFNAAKFERYTKEEDTMLLGTKGYAAPEQYGFGVSNTQTDIYALGMLMNTLVLGHFSSSVVGNSEFSPIIHKCVELRPEDRYSSVYEVKEHLLNPDAAVGRSTVVINHSVSQSGWQSWLPPGFRTRNIIKMISASVVYLFFAWTCFGLKVQSADSAQLLVEKIGSFILVLLFIFTMFNYRGMADIFPLCRSPHLPLRILGRFLVGSIACFLLFCLIIIFIAIV